MINSKKMYIRRHIDVFLEDWFKNKNRLPLIIKGARKTGKSDSIRRFGSRHFKHFYEVNFEEEPKLTAITKGNFSVEEILGRLLKLKPEWKLEPNRTLIFFNEVQACPQILYALNNFRKDYQYSIIFAGSYFDHDVKADYELKAIDFEEYLWWMGYSQEDVHDILNHMLNKEPFTPEKLADLNQHYEDFCHTGGMPESIQLFLKTKAYDESLEFQKKLVEIYKNDIVKYSKRSDVEEILTVFDNVASQLQKPFKKFQVTKLKDGARLSQYEGAINWLSYAGIIKFSNYLDLTEGTFYAKKDQSKYKIYFHDTSLLRPFISTINDFGAIKESLAAETLVKSGMELCYYKKPASTLEEDFFVQTKNGLVPIEVRTTDGNSKALSTLIASNEYSSITWGIKLYEGNLKWENNVLYLPRCCGFLIKNMIFNNVHFNAQ